VSRLDIIVIASNCLAALMLFVWLVNQLINWWEAREPKRLPGNLGERTVIVELVADTSQFESAMRQAAAATNRLIERLAGGFKPWAVTDWGRKFNLRREVKLAGLGARFYVRGGLECRSVEDVTSHVRRVLHADPLALALLADSTELVSDPPTRRERCELAVEVMKGYVLHMDDRLMGPPPPAPEHGYSRSVMRIHWWGRSRGLVVTNLTGRTFTGWTPATPLPTQEVPHR
jgi:hypothetical protein